MVKRLAVVLFTLAAAVAAQTGPSAASYSQLPWRYIGTMGNRTDAVEGVPGDPKRY